MPQSAKPNKSKSKKRNHHYSSKRNNQFKRNKHYTKRSNNNTNKSNEISKQTMHDPRFKKVFTDPRYQSMPQQQKDPNKVQVDSRFASMFTDPAFRTQYRIDRYGREITNNEAYDLHKFYQLNPNNDNNNTQNEGYEAEQEDNDEHEKQNNKPISNTIQKQVDKFKAEQNNEISEDDKFWNQWDENEKDNTNQTLTTKEEKLLNRKAGYMFAYDADSTTPSEAQSDYDYNKLTMEEVGDDSRAILYDKNNDRNSEPHCEATNTLAIVNCDWDNISARDIYMIFRSFLASEGSIIKVCIYPSEYGIKMMKKEQQTGPDADIWENNTLSNDVKQMEDLANFIDANEQQNENENETDNNNNNNEIDMEMEMEMDDKTRELHEEMYELEKLEDTIKAIKEGRAGDVIEDEMDTIYNKQALRKYELQKLRYYYAIAEFDSIETADKLYQQLNHREYRHTCNVLNLSFVSHDFIAPHEPSDICADIPDNYVAASDKQTNALGSTFLELSWDKTDPNRVELCQRSFTTQQLNSMDLEAYLQESDAITDAGFDTDYPVTEYDTDTPNKKVIIKRKARLRYANILSEFKQMENNIHGSDSDGNVSATSNTDDENGFGFGINVGGGDMDDDVLQQRLRKKEGLYMDKIRQSKLHIENLSTSEEEEEEKEVDDGNKEDSFYIDDEISKLNEWIDTQKRLKESIHKSIDDNDLEMSKVNAKKRKREEMDEQMLDSDDEALIVSGDDMDDDELNDPYFKSEMKDIIVQPQMKRQKLDDNNEESEKKKRAMLEMIMASNDSGVVGTYDPENNEMDTEKLRANLNRKLRRNWRLRARIKKKVKEKLKEMDTFQFNENDTRFGALINDPDFAIDPTNVAFKNTKAMMKLLSNTRKERQKKWNRKQLQNNSSASNVIDSKSIIESLKMKNRKINKLKDGQKIRSNITQKLKQKGLSSFHS